MVYFHVDFKHQQKESPSSECIIKQHKLDYTPSPLYQRQIKHIQQIVNRSQCTRSVFSIDHPSPAPCSQHHGFLMPWLSYSAQNLLWTSWRPICIFFVNLALNSNSLPTFQKSPKLKEKQMFSGNKESVNWCEFCSDVGWVQGQSVLAADEEGPG